MENIETLNPKTKKIAVPKKKGLDKKTIIIIIVIAIGIFLVWKYVKF